MDLCSCGDGSWRGRGDPTAGFPYCGPVATGRAAGISSRWLSPRARSIAGDLSHMNSDVNKTFAHTGIYSYIRINKGFCRAHGSVSQNNRPGQTDKSATNNRRVRMNSGLMYGWRGKLYIPKYMASFQIRLLCPCLEGRSWLRSACWSFFRSIQTDPFQGFRGSQIASYARFFIWLTSRTVAQQVLLSLAVLYMSGNYSLCLSYVDSTRLGAVAHGLLV